MKTALILIGWFVVANLVCCVGFELLNERSSMANLVGFLGVCSFGVLSVYTRCFTNFNFKQKDGKSNEQD